jgi:hypothetical protein
MSENKRVTREDLVEFLDLPDDLGPVGPDCLSVLKDEQLMALARYKHMYDRAELTPDESRGFSEIRRIVKDRIMANRRRAAEQSWDAIAYGVREDLWLSRS